MGSDAVVQQLSPNRFAAEPGWKTFTPIRATSVNTPMGYPHLELTPDRRPRRTILVYPIRTEENDMQTLSYTVPDMSCAHCRKAVTEEVTKVDGVDSVDVDLDTKLVLVHGDDVDDAAVREAIEEAGYGTA
ncbi:MAG: heavy-metal-associated domain-containing protein [Verrucomicrobiota bacterium]